MRDRLSLRSVAIVAWWVRCFLIIVLAAPRGTAAVPPPSLPPAPVDLYMRIGEWPLWFGTTIRYTVYQPTRVEARVISVTGEITAVLQEGIKQPGQYTLPFDGNYHGAQYAGYYTFELYFGDEYAAKYEMIAIPATQPL